MSPCGRRWRPLLFACLLLVILAAWIYTALLQSNGVVTVRSARHTRMEDGAYTWLDDERLLYLRGSRGVEQQTYDWRIWRRGTAQDSPVPTLTNAWRRYLGDTTSVQFSSDGSWVCWGVLPPPDAEGITRAGTCACQVQSGQCYQWSLEGDVTAAEFTSDGTFIEVHRTEHKTIAYCVRLLPTGIVGPKVASAAKVSAAFVTMQLTPEPAWWSDTIHIYERGCPDRLGPIRRPEPKRLSASEMRIVMPGRFRDAEAALSPSGSSVALIGMQAVSPGFLQKTIGLITHRRPGPDYYSALLVSKFKPNARARMCAQGLHNEREDPIDDTAPICPRALKWLPSEKAVSFVWEGNLCLAPISGDL